MESQTVLEYNCPCCGAALKFSPGTQKLQCEYCDNTFDPEIVDDYARSSEQKDATAFTWKEIAQSRLAEEDAQAMQTYTCQSCGGVLLAEKDTVATFCPYCESPTIVNSRITGEMRPDALIPFHKTKEDAMSAFRALCKNKPLLPSAFTEDHRVEKISGIYVPFWLYDCEGQLQCAFKATRLHHWSDSRYNYTRTDHYLLHRDAQAEFQAIPMDASSRINNTIMESIEPYDYSQLVDFEKAYLSGFLADKYDVKAKSGEDRIKERSSQTLMAAVNQSLIGYATAVPISKQLHVNHSIAKYVLLPVWMLHTKYKDQTYIFAMNGQTGKMTGTFPICPQKSALWFAGIFAAVTLLTGVLGSLLG